MAATTRRRLRRRRRPVTRPRRTGASRTRRGSTRPSTSVVADGTAPPFADGVVRPGAARRAVLGPRRAAPARRCALADHAPTTIDDLAAAAAAAARRRGAARAAGRHAGLQRLHADRGRVDRPSDSRRLRGRSPTRRPATWRPFAARLARAAARRRHRRHGADSIPSDRMSAEHTERRRVPHGQGPDRQRRRGRTAPATTPAAGAGRRSSPRRASRSSSTASRPTATRRCAAALTRHERRLRRPDRVDRRHRLRAARPDAGGHAPGRSSARRPASPRRCGWSARSAGCRAASPASAARRSSATRPARRRAASSSSARSSTSLPHALRSARGIRARPPH